MTFKMNEDILDMIIKARENYRNELHRIQEIIQTRPHIENISQLELGSIVKFKNQNIKKYISGIDSNKSCLLFFPWDYNPNTNEYYRDWISIDKLDIKN
jgi:hypothetical protein